MTVSYKPPAVGPLTRRGATAREPNVGMHAHGVELVLRDCTLPSSGSRHDACDTVPRLGDAPPPALPGSHSWSDPAMLNDGTMWASPGRCRAKLAACSTLLAACERAAATELETLPEPAEPMDRRGPARMKLRGRCERVWARRPAQQAQGCARLDVGNKTHAVARPER